VTIATLSTIAAAAERDGLEAPVVTVIGEVARRSEPGLYQAAVEPVVLAAAGA
jgi:siroheme synthase